MAANIVWALSFVLLLLPDPAFGQLRQIDDVFEVHRGNPLLNGGCDDEFALDTNGRRHIDNIWEDCYQLVNAAVRVLDLALDNTVPGQQRDARQLSTTFFGTPAPDTAGGDQIIMNFRAWFQDVRQFMEGGRTGFNGEHYILFCHDTWLQRRAWTDNAQQDGGLVLDGNSQPVPLQNIEQYAGFMHDGLVPYWAAEFEEYIFDEPYTRAGNRFCGGPRHGNFAATQEQTRRKTVTVCPYGWRRAPPRLPLDRLGEEQVNANQRIQTFGCAAMNLFHELFHVVEGNGITDDSQPPGM
ncbi:hypothetical protein MFIFM68171_06617 [Madurella fahalii]|uniref:Lysine-specific metallo-endopeptidase domain-containing protein n=1 Tax=Madurella fahalii TaxID=1157608 RepID=A0ABQ0GFA1_9PEZI